MYSKIVLQEHTLDRNDFMLCEKIKQGGFDNVMLIKNKKTHASYAAKMLKTDTFTQEMIDQEIYLRIKANHSTINQFVGFINYDLRTVILVMKKSQNNSLMDVFTSKLNSSGNYYDNTARQIILVGIAYGMSYLHKNLIHHRSLTPECILLDKNYYPNITDFEFEKPQSRSFKIPIYSAPEYLKDKIFNDKSDVYSFGIIMYQIITNQDPFPEVMYGKMSEVEFKFKVINENLRPKIPEEFNYSLADLLSKCWSGDPNERPSFNEIYQKLYYDFNYHLDNVDTVKLFRYVSAIEMDSKEEAKIIQKTNNYKLNINKVHSTS